MTLSHPDYDARTNPLVTCPRCGETKHKISPAGRVWLEDNANHCKTCEFRMKRGG